MQGKHEEHKGEGKGKKQLPILQIAVLILGILLVWWFLQSESLGPFAKKTQEPIPAANSEDLLKSPGAAVLLGAMEKLAAIPQSYEIEFRENIDGIDSNVTLRQNENIREAIVQTQFHARQYIWNGNYTMLCEQALGKKELCAQIDELSPAARYAILLNATFPGASELERKKEAELDRELISGGALRFIAAPQDKKIAGRACKNVIYSLDFGALNSSQKADFDPRLFVFKNYRLEKCIDEETGIPLYIKLKYEYGGQAIEEERTYTRFASPSSKKIVEKAANANISEVEKEYDQDNQILQMMGECYLQEDAGMADKCILSGAIGLKQYGLCHFASTQETQEDCIYKLASILDEPEYCEKAGKYRDECYTSIAARRSDASYCTMVNNQAAKEICGDLFKNSTLATENRTG